MKRASLLDKEFAMDIEGLQVERAAQLAAADAIRRATKLGGRIAELQSRETQQSAAVLNDKPAPKSSQQ